MTHCERVLELLSDGREHSHHELYALNVVAHSRVAELRKRGHVITCKNVTDLTGQRVSVYQLHSLRDARATERLGPDGSLASQSEDGAPADPGSANPLKPSSSLASDDSDEQLRMVIAA